MVSTERQPPVLLQVEDKVAVPACRGNMPGALHSRGGQLRHPQHRRHLRAPDQVRPAEGAAPQVLHRGGQGIMEKCFRFSWIYSNCVKYKSIMYRAIINIENESQR